MVSSKCLEREGERQREGKGKGMGKGKEVEGKGKESLKLINQGVSHKLIEHLTFSGCTRSKANPLLLSLQRLVSVYS
jgi:hypothetical protein